MCPYLSLSVSAGIILLLVSGQQTSKDKERKRHMNGRGLMPDHDCLFPGSPASLFHSQSFFQFSGSFVFIFYYVSGELFGRKIGGELVREKVAASWINHVLSGSHYSSLSDSPAHGIINAGAGGCSKVKDKERTSAKE